ncbi:mitochondrial import inner membrane translocase subunit [Cryptosporidium xiaoi]|uniref:Mitochondrial import inner membrane translocase subunit n=1 Tax=Cryptosporidium xiaoi TaxID=659607 RepID=A0AAV9XZ51_9CRYT
MENSDEKKTLLFTESPNISEDTHTDPALIEKLNIKKRQDFFLNDYDRLWGEKLTYSVGFSYGTGLFIGSTYGLFNAFRKPALTTRLRINSILNECTLKSTNIANPMSVISKLIIIIKMLLKLRHKLQLQLAMFYCGFYRISKAIRKKDDFFNSAISGAISGALYKSASSRKMMIRYSIFSSGKLRNEKYFKHCI